MLPKKSPKFGPHLNESWINIVPPDLQVLAGEKEADIYVFECDCFSFQLWDACVTRLQVVQDK